MTEFTKPFLAASAGVSGIGFFGCQFAIWRNNRKMSNIEEKEMNRIDWQSLEEDGHREPTLVAEEKTTATGSKP